MMASLSTQGSLLLLLAFCMTLTLGRDLRYEMIEESAARSFQKNIKTESGLNAKYEESVLRELRFAFLSLNKERNMFELDEVSGILRNAQPIDRDELCPNQAHCVISLVVAVQPSQYFEEIRITIQLTDKNDNSPEFPEARIVKMISEASAPGILFPILPAKDPDSPDFSIKEYHLTPDSELFSLQVTRNEDGSFDLQLVLEDNLDREVEDLYQMQVTAYDGGDPAKSGSVLVDIVVDDINDNNPQFQQDVYEESVSENLPVNWTVAQVHATDPDDGPNGEIVYMFTRKTTQLYGNLFRIDPQFGTITLKSPLDYETHKSITLGVLARDNGPSSVPSQAIVVITILDINDNAPVITLNPENRVDKTTVEIPEHSVKGTFVAHITAIDPDGGDNGGVRCEMQHDHFSLVKLISGEFKIVTTQVIDRELSGRRVLTSFHLSITCRDQGTDVHMTSTFNLTVHIKDVNDHAPQFNSSTYNVSLPENNPPNEIIYRTFAYDPDEGRNGEIVYIIKGNLRNKFSIDPSTGIITALVTFNREDVDKYEFQVVAQDKGPDARASTATVTVTILDQDDEVPKFTEPQYEFFVLENLRNTQVGSVLAIDKDLPPYNNVTYILDPKTSDVSSFRVDHNTGMIYTKRPLDREEESVYYLTIMAQTTTFPSPFTDSVIVTVHVKDQNDNKPVIRYPINGNQTVIIANTVPQGHLVATVDAWDKDCGDSCTFTYSIVGGALQGEFYIQPKTGEIFVNTQLDGIAPASYRLILQVSDNGEPEPLMAMSELNIEVVPGSIGSPQTSRTGLAISHKHLAIIIGVILGCLLIPIIIIIFILVIRRKNKMAAVNKSPSPDGQLYWPRAENQLVVAGGTESTSPTDSEKSGNIIDPMAITLQAEDTVAAKLAELAEQEAVKAGTFNKPKLAVLHPPPSNRHRIIHGDSSQGNSVQAKENDYVDLKAKNDTVTTVAVKCYPSNGSPRPPHPAASPRKMESFSDWLQSESYNLKQEGHSYRVADKDSLRKSVRFNTAERNRNNGAVVSEAEFPPPPPPDSLQLSSDSKYPTYNTNLGSLV